MLVYKNKKTEYKNILRMNLIKMLFPPLCHSERSEESRGSETIRESILDSSPAGSE